jgi:hypothetical protein
VDRILASLRHLADDPKMDERYARKAIYGESMY